MFATRDRSGTPTHRPFGVVKTAIKDATGESVTEKLGEEGMSSDVGHTWKCPSRERSGKDRRSETARFPPGSRLGCLGRIS